MAERNGKNLITELQEKLLEVIENTEAGEKLLTEPALAKQFGVSRSTLREAMRIFETQGLIRRKQGAGTFVQRPSHRIETGLEVLESIHTLAERIGLPADMGNYQIEYRQPTEDEQEILNINNKTNVHEISRVMKTEDRPVAYLVDIVSETNLTIEEINIDFNGSILDLLSEKEETVLSTSRTEISAVAATPKVAKALGIQRGDVLLYFEAKLFTKAGEMVDLSTSYFLPGYFKFHVVRRVN